MTDTKAFTDELLKSFWDDHVADSSKSDEYRRNAIKAWTWVCPAYKTFLTRESDMPNKVSKALLLRTHASSPQYTDKLFSLLSDPSIAWDSARALGNAISADHVLTKRNHAVLKILHAQKYVNSVLPRIMQGATDSNSS